MPSESEYPAEVTSGSPSDLGPATAPGEGFRLRSFLNGSLALDVVVPIVAYQVMIHLLGVSRVPALVLSGAFPAVNVARRYMRDRRVDPVGVIVLQHPRRRGPVARLRQRKADAVAASSFLTAAFGIAFLVSLLFGKPIMFLLIRQFVAQEDERQLKEWDARWDDTPEFRRVMRQMTAMWGVALLAEFALKVVMVETLSTDVVQAISGPLILGFTAVLIVVTIRWGRRSPERRATAEAAGR